MILWLKKKFATGHKLGDLTHEKSQIGPFCVKSVVWKSPFFIFPSLTHLIPLTHLHNL